LNHHHAAEEFHRSHHRWQGRHLDVLVNNAGFGVFKPLVETDRAAFEAVSEARREGQPTTGASSRSAG
jgi:short-subunit dehydrogenase